MQKVTEKEFQAVMCKNNNIGTYHIIYGEMRYGFFYRNKFYFKKYEDDGSSQIFKVLSNPQNISCA